MLGTAQLGFHYGIGNRVGKPDPETAVSIIRAAWDGGIEEFDTARDYGESEKVLGRVFRRLGIAQQVKVIGKFDPKTDASFQETLVRMVEDSRNRLGIPAFSGIMMHSEAIMDRWSREIERALRKILEQRLTERIGISVYTPRTALRAMKREPVSMIQIPSNICDRRFESAGVFEKAEASATRVYVRSVYLQGLLLFPALKTPPSMKHAKPVLERIDRFLAREAVERKTLLLGYVRDAYPNARIVVGAETGAQVRENLGVWLSKLPPHVVEKIPSVFTDARETLLNPSLWPA